MLTAGEVIAKTGVTRRQLDYWCRLEVIPTVEGQMPGSGHNRLFDDDSVDRIKILVKISKVFNNRIGTEHLRMIYANEQKSYIDLGDGVTLSWNRAKILGGK